MLWGVNLLDASRSYITECKEAEVAVRGIGAVLKSNANQLILNMYQKDNEKTSFQRRPQSSSS